MPRFVILEHDHPALHWDLMLEAGDVLRTWRLASPPRLGESVTAERIADHRRAYLDYEGPVSGGRGAVTRWDAGNYSIITEGGGRLCLRLEGTKVRGAAHLPTDGAGEFVLSPEIGG